MVKKILIVEDEASLAKILRFDLETAGFLVKHSENGKKAYSLAHQETFDCFIIDWMVPLMSGPELIQKLRSEGNQAVMIMLTAKNTEFDAIEGLSRGADIYLKKPTSNRELIAQIKALLSRFDQDKKQQANNITFGDISLDLRQFTVKINDRPINLTKMEFDLLKFFILNKEQALTRDGILNSIWGFNYDGTTRIVDVHVYNLKRKLAQSSAYFKPIRGVGYSLMLR
jgi:DNA-binding response OmpR family regulator